MKQYLKSIIIKIPQLKNYYIRYYERRGSIVKISNLNLNIADKVLLDKPLKKSIFVGLVKDNETIYEDYVLKRAYYPKYERFLKNNNIQYEYYDIHSDNWQKNAEHFDAIIWQTSSNLATLYHARNKIFVLEKLMGKNCLPRYEELWSYEDKINMHYLYKHHNLPEIPTFSTALKKEAQDFASNTNYPFISKIPTSSSSYGVEIVRSQRQANRIIEKVFSNRGRKTPWQYQRQKDYVLFQKFVTAAYDLRVIIVGDKLFGYYRYPQKGDFRASGSGILEKKEVPIEALQIAYKVKEAFNTTILATDLLFNEKEKKYMIIESSISIGIDTCEQLKVNEIPGYYKRVSQNDFVFIEGRYWIQELALKEFLEKYYC